MIPKDPVMLLSYVNTQLRDFYSSFEGLCEDKGLNAEEIQMKLSGIDYVYDLERNQFVKKFYLGLTKQYKKKYDEENR